MYYTYVQDDVFLNVVMGYADMHTDMFGGVCRNVQPVHLFYKKRSISKGSNNINSDFVVVIHSMFDIFVYLQVLPG